MAEKFKIDRLYAFVIDKQDESEGVCTFGLPEGGLILLVATNKEMVETMRPLAADVARQKGKPVKLICFSTREQIEQILPRTYEIKGKTITCLMCGRKSFHPQDVANKYCAHCKRFHED